MSKTAYEIESELGGSSENRTGFGGRPELINFYMESPSDLSALPVLDQMTIDALRCGKIIPLLTIADMGEGAIATFVAGVRMNDAQVGLMSNNEAIIIYTIATKTWAVGE